MIVIVIVLEIVIGRWRSGEGCGDLHHSLLLLLHLAAIAELGIPTTEMFPLAFLALPLPLGSFLLRDLVLLLVDLQVQVEILQVVRPAGDQLRHLVDRLVDGSVLVELLISTALHHIARINIGINISTFRMIKHSCHQVICYQNISNNQVGFIF